MSSVPGPQTETGPAPADGARPLGGGERGGERRHHFPITGDLLQSVSLTSAKAQLAAHGSSPAAIRFNELH